MYVEENIFEEWTHTLRFIIRQKKSLGGKYQ